MASRRLYSLLALSAALLISLPAVAQDAPAAPRPTGGPGGPGHGGARGPRPAPTNLKVLPKTTTGDDIVKLMGEYRSALGVQCNYCHAANPETNRIEYPSDANRMKDKARFMIGMTADLNNKYLAALPDRMTTDPITCGTCHRGQSHPPVFVPAPQQRPGGPPPGAGGPPPATP